MTNFQTKDSGKRIDYPSGMRRDIQEGKPDFALIMAEELPYEEQLLTRWAALMQRGAEKYGERNWEKANSKDELRRFWKSAFRHFIQAMCGLTDEDHFAAVLFNLNAIVFLQWKMRQE